MKMRRRKAGEWAVISLLCGYVTLLLGCGMAVPDETTPSVQTQTSAETTTCVETTASSETTTATLFETVESETETSAEETTAEQTTPVTSTKETTALPSTESETETSTLSPLTQDVDVDAGKIVEKALEEGVEAPEIFGWSHGVSTYVGVPLKLSIPNRENVTFHVTLQHGGYLRFV